MTEYNLKFQSRRPSVKSVTSWVTVYDKTVTNDWRGLPDSHMLINKAEFIPNYYQLVLTVNGKKNTKYFYGEKAWYSLSHYASTQGHYL